MFTLLAPSAIFVAALMAGAMVAATSSIAFGVLIAAIGWGVAALVASAAIYWYCKNPHRL